MGAAFGVAYLIRQEAVAPLLIAVFFVLTATEGKIAIRCKRAVAAIAVFLALAAPEIVFIYRAIGQVASGGQDRHHLATCRSCFE